MQTDAARVARSQVRAARATAKRSKPSRDVLVLGDTDMAGLAIVRSLGRAGLRVHLAPWHESRVTRVSTHVHRLCDLGHPRRDPDGFIRQLATELARARYDLVIPVTDEPMILMHLHRRELAPLARLAMPDAEGFRVAHDKYASLQLARQCGLDTPHTHLLTGLADLETFPLPAEYPVVLKPVHSFSVEDLWGPRLKVRVVRSEAELLDRLRAMLPVSPVLVQECCPGIGMGIEVLAQRGEVVAAFQHQRVHEPVEGGASSYRRSVPLWPELLDGVEAVCRTLGWHGPAMFEFKHEPRSGRTWFMELNGRFWGSLALPMRAGVDFPRLLYEMEVLGRTPRCFQYHSGEHLRHLRRDLLWLPSNARAPAGERGWLKVPTRQWLGEWAHWLRGREGFDIESLEDPLPGLLSLVEMAQELSCRMTSRALWQSYRQVARTGVSRFHAGSLRSIQRVRQARSILFVCAGNINRSAFAAAYLGNRLGNDDRVRVASSGTLDIAGRGTSELSIQAAARYGVDLSGHLSAGLTRRCLRHTDLILVMDIENLQGVCRVDPDARAKTLMLSALDDANTPLEIADPHGQSLEFFVATYGRIARCVDALAELLQNLSSQQPAPEAEPSETMVQES